MRPILPPCRSYPVYAASLNRVQGDSTLTYRPQLSRLLLAEADRHVPVLLGTVDNESIWIIGPEWEARLLSFWHLKLINFLNRLLLTVKPRLINGVDLGVPLRP